MLNDGSGRFSNASAGRVPRTVHDSEDIGIADFDGDGDADLDIVLANAFNGSYRVYLNDGAGVFSDQTSVLFPATISGDGIDVEAVDLDGDLLVDLFLCYFTGAYRLLLQVKADE